MKRTYDWRRDYHDPRDVRYTIPFEHMLLALPTSVDLRPQCPPVYDQGHLGSCVGNSLAGLYEFIDSKLNPAQTPWVPSRLFIYWGARALEGTVHQDAGCAIRDGMKVLATKGVSPETAWPYDISKFEVEPPRDVWSLAWHHKIGLYVRLDSTKLDEMRSCLAAGFPFSFGFTVYESFESEVVAQTGIVPMPRRGERILGGHAVLAVGYDDSTGHLIVRNSWGDGWGLGGYFMMPYAYATNVGLAADFWTARKAS